MKKTYLIKDQGKGLVENLTPDKLFDIANGGSGEVDNSNDYSIDEIQVGKFIYQNGGHKVSKPKYRKVINGNLDSNGSLEIDYLPFNLETMLPTTSATISHNIYKLIVPYTDVYNNIYANIYQSTEDKLIIVKFYAVDNNLFQEVTLTLEYTKTTDTETIIEPMS